jgi:hypothetical protein
MKSLATTEEKVFNCTKSLIDNAAQGTDALFVGHVPVPGQGLRGLRGTSPG